MTDTIKLLGRFKKDLVEFFDELIVQFPSDSELIVLRTFIQHQAPIEMLMRKFSVAINKPIKGGDGGGDQKKIRDLIIAKDENLFVHYNMFFFCDKNQEPESDIDTKAVTKDNANHFRQLWLSGRLDNSDKAVVWSWLYLFVTLSDKYMVMTRSLKPFK